MVVTVRWFKRLFIEIQNKFQPNSTVDNIPFLLIIETYLDR